MTISVNYPTPVEVNGYSCKNCTDVDYAKKHIDPAHPKDGPFGINAKDKPGHTDPSKSASGPSSPSPAVKLDGIFSGLNPPPAGLQPTSATGTLVDIAA